jgi:hypothetical protein
MLRRLVILTLFLSAEALAKEDYRDQPCKTPQLAPSCVRFHGRLVEAEGHPSYRLWQMGTRHIYGIFSNRYGLAHDVETLDSEGPNLPPAVESTRSKDGQIYEVFADFEVCPLEPHIPGHMQAACIASASHITVPKE